MSEEFFNMVNQERYAEITDDFLGSLDLNNEYTRKAFLLCLNKKLETFGPEYTGETPNNSLDVIKYLVGLGINLDFTREDGKDILSIAIEGGNKEVVRAVLSSDSITKKSFLRR